MAKRCCHYLGSSTTAISNSMLTSGLAGAFPPAGMSLGILTRPLDVPSTSSFIRPRTHCSHFVKTTLPFKSQPRSATSLLDSHEVKDTSGMNLRNFHLDSVVSEWVRERNFRYYHFGESITFQNPTPSSHWKSHTFRLPEYVLSSVRYCTAVAEVAEVANVAAVPDASVLERGKSWKGRGWNRDPTSEVIVASPVDKGGLPVPNLQFDNIPDLDEKLKFLETCGLGDNQLIQMRKRLPSAVKNTFLKLSMKKLIEVATFLDDEVGVERKDFGNLLFANPYIAGSSVDECLRPKVEFLRKRGITKVEMGKMVLRSPQILTYSLEGKLLAIEQKLLEVGLKDDEIGRVFVRYPALIGTSIGKFDKNVQSLREAGISEVARAIFKIPQIMSLSLESKYNGIWNFLRDELQLENEQISKIVCSQISILSFSVETNIRPKVGFFSEMGLQKDDIARLVVKYPNIFCHSLENSIKPKVQYLVKVMNLQIMELISFPHYLSYSLLDRIKPRHEYVAKYGFTYKLSSLLSCCENVFHKRYPKPLVAFSGSV